MNICLFKNVECKYAGEIVYSGCKEFGEKIGIHKVTYCYNDFINRVQTKCNVATIKR